MELNYHVIVEVRGKLFFKDFLKGYLIDMNNIVFWVDKISKKDKVINKSTTKDGFKFDLILSKLLLSEKNSNTSLTLINLLLFFINWQKQHEGNCRIYNNQIHIHFNK